MVMFISYSFILPLEAKCFASTIDSNIVEPIYVCCFTVYMFANCGLQHTQHVIGQLGRWQKSRAVQKWDLLPESVQRVQKETPDYMRDALSIQSVKRAGPESKHLPAPLKDNYHINSI